jgi:SlyX protein
VTVYLSQVYLVTLYISPLCAQTGSSRRRSVMAGDIDELKQQMMELQSQLAFQEDALGSLDQALAQQQQEILQLRRQLELLRQRQQEQAANNEAGHSSVTPDEKPPHY